MVPTLIRLKIAGDLLRNEGKKMRVLVLFLAIIVCVGSLSDTAMAQSAGTGGTRQYGSTPQMVFPIRPRNGPARSTAVPTVRPYPPVVVPFRQNYPVIIRR